MRHESGSTAKDSRTGGNRAVRPAETGRALVVAGLALAATISLFSYYADPLSYLRKHIPSNGRLELIERSSTAGWWESGDLSAAEINFNNETGAIEIEIRNKPETLVGVNYTVALVLPGWYEFSGEVRAEGVDPKKAGAQLKVTTGDWGFVAAAETPTTGAWRNTDIYFRPPESDHQATVSCLLSTTGKGSFRNVKLASIRGAPPAKALIFDLGPKKLVSGKESKPAGHHRIWTVAVTVSIAAIIVGVSFTLFDKI